jgi:hypothetical protein
MIRMLVGLTAAVLVGASAPAAMAGDPDYGSAPRSGSRLTLSYLADAGYAAAVKITCEPAGGAHPEAAEVCATLARTGADPSKITPAPTLCTMIYSPITAEVSGTWRGTPVAWKQSYGNACEMRRATGALFRF